MSDCFVQITGNLTRDPELRYLADGSAVVSLRLAFSRRYQVRGEWQEKTSYIDVSAWRELAEHVAASATKGTRVTVTGHLEQREFTDKTGNERSVLEVTAAEVAISLRWATAEVTRSTGRADGETPRRSNGAGRGSSAPVRVTQGGGDPFTAMVDHTEPF
jgi:single-strand DNA-binding protein